MNSKTSLNMISEERGLGRSSSGLQYLVGWWYRLAAPREVPSDAPFKMREAVRRGRTASWILLVVIGLVLLPIPGASREPNVLTILLIVLLIDLAALLLNRLRQTVLAGILAIITIELGLLGTILTAPGGVGPSNLPLFDLMTQAEIVAVALFAPGWVFIIMGLNIGIILTILHARVISPELAYLLAKNGNLFTQSFELQIIIAIFSFILVQSANRAIMKLDRSEEIVALERREIEQQEKQLVLKEQLELGIKQILQTLINAANGNFSVRVPLNRENVLWQVAYSLNNLLSRLERNNQLQGEMRRTQEAVKLLAENLRTAKLNHQPLQLPPRTGTVVDELIVELTVSSGISSQAQTKRLHPSLENGTTSSFQESSGMRGNSFPPSKYKTKE